MTEASIEIRALAEARRWIGTPYMHQASVCQKGADCLGLIRGIWRYLYGTEPEKLPAYTLDWGEVSEGETVLLAMDTYFAAKPILDAAEGNVVVFRWDSRVIAKHLGVLSGNNRFIHAYEKAGTIETTLGSHWRRRITAAYAFPR